MAFLKYWHRIANFRESENKLLYNAFCENVKGNSTWFQSITKLLDMVNVKAEHAMKNNVKLIIRKVQMFFKEAFVNGWKQELFDDSRKGNFGNKLRSYRTYKSGFSVEHYLLKCNSMVHRKNIARLRLSSHKLHIETGRYLVGIQRLKPHERICYKCNSNECEDEFHLIVKCKFYDNIREQLLNKLYELYPFYKSMSDNDKFIFIMSNRNKYIINETGNFITRSFELRNNG